MEQMGGVNYISGNSKCCEKFAILSLKLCPEKWDKLYLWNDRNLSPQIVKTHVRNVKAVNIDGATSCLDDPEEGQRQ